LHYGDYVLLKHQSTGVTIASDSSIDTNPPHQQYLIVGSDEKRPLARNTFRIMRPPSSLSNEEDDHYESDDIVRYGSSFLLVCNESLLVSDDGYCMNPPLYLSSLQRNYRTATRITNKQSVYLTTQCDAEAVWIAALVSHGKAIDWGNKYRGDPVLSGDLFLLKHRHTNTCLTINTAERCQTDYGYELEVITSPETSVGKLSLVEYELSGQGTSRTLRKPDLQSHEIMFVTSSHPRHAIDHRDLPTASRSTQELLQDLAASLRSLGLSTFIELRKECLDLDRGGRFAASYSSIGTGSPRGQVDVIDFKKILEQHGIVCESYYDQLFEVFMVPPPPYGSSEITATTATQTQARVPSRGGTNRQSSSYEINYRQLIERLRGKISSKRSQHLVSIYEHLRLNGNPSSTQLAVRELCERFQPHGIPLFNEGRLSPDQFRVKYLERVLDTVRDGRGVVCVTEDGFVNYWSDYSPLLEEDEDYEHFVEECCGL
jgi:hypothetical protein